MSGEGGPSRRRRARAARCCVPTTRRPGRNVGPVYIPAAQTGSPMTYMLNGKQYLVLAVGGQNHHGELIAFALP